MRFSTMGLRAGLVLGSACIVGITTVSLTTFAAPRPISSNIADYAATKMEDFTATVKVLQHDDKAGRKINKDFGLLYKIKGDILLRYKEPNKLRIDGNLGTSKATLINSGSMQHVRMPGVGLKDDRDLGQSLGKRKTLLDVGLISAGYLSYTQAEFKGQRPVDGVPCAVFKISYRNKDLDTSFRMVWIDPKTKITVKREEYTQDGKLNATFLYKRPQQVASGIWFPSEIEVINNEGQKAGTTAYRNVQVNTGLGDSVFK